MPEALLIAIVSAAASALTLYSGFGLGTILLPAFALFFPAPLAVAATGIVHLLNNLFKVALVGRRADWGIVLRFGLPAVPAAVAGALLLTWLGETPRLFEWSAGGRIFGPTGAGVTIGIMMILFAILELQPWFQRLAAPPRLLPPGGLLTGFVGGLTGQQGALRSMFLLRCRLSPERFIATGVLIAVLVDLSRLPAYAAGKRGVPGRGVAPDRARHGLRLCGRLARRALHQEGHDRDRQGHRRWADVPGRRRAARRPGGMT